MSHRPARFWMLVLGGAVAAVLLVFTLLLVRYAMLERRFREIHPDDSEARLLEVAGHPTSIRRCGEGTPRMPAPGVGNRPCARVYWYSTYVFSDGWLVPIDDAGYIMQIRRMALP